MHLFEHEAKDVLRHYEIEVPRGLLLDEPGQAEFAARRLGGSIVLKAQTLSGGRMKAGAVRFADGPAEAPFVARSVAAADLPGPRPLRVLAEERVTFEREFYIGITFDDAARLPVVIISSAGGIDVEEAPPGSVVRHHLSTLLPTQNFLIKDALSELGITGQDLVDLTIVVSRLHRAFVEHDLLLAEVNPLVKASDGRWLALDCHMELDDDALFRQQPFLRDLGLDPATRHLREPTLLEQAAERIDRSDHRGVAGRVVEFDGTLGLLIGGGGASLTAFDAIRSYGGEPANYCEIGGNPSVRKVAELTRLLLASPRIERIAVIMNVVNNTRADIIARGVIKGCLDAGKDPATAIAVFRIPGAWEEEAARLLAKYGVQHLGREVTIDEAARLAVESMR